MASASVPDDVDRGSPRIPFPWTRVIALLLVGCSAPVIAGVVGLVFLSYFSAGSVQLVEVNGYVGGTWLDTPILLTVGSAFGALGVALNTNRMDRIRAAAHPKTPRAAS